jgi:hypothetical protein
MTATVGPSVASDCYRRWTIGQKQVWQPKHGQASGRSRLVSVHSGGPLTFGVSA